MRLRVALGYRFSFIPFSLRCLVFVDHFDGRKRGSAATICSALRIPARSGFFLSDTELAVRDLSDSRGRDAGDVGGGAGGHRGTCVALPDGLCLVLRLDASAEPGACMRRGAVPVGGAGIRAKERAANRVSLEFARLCGGSQSGAGAIGSAGRRVAAEFLGDGIQRAFILGLDGIASGEANAITDRRGKCGRAALGCRVWRTLGPGDTSGSCGAIGAGEFSRAGLISTGLAGYPCR